MAVVHRPAPETIERSQLTAFLRACDQPDSAALQAWALAEPEAFWRAFVTWSGLRVSGSTTPAITGEGVESARFFPQLRLNYAQALLYSAEVDPEATAITSVTESSTEHLSWSALRDRVARVAGGLKARGVVEGDRVVAVVRNTAEAVVGALATAGLGATWSSAAPDMAPAAILQRFAQLAPRWLITHTEREYQGRVTPVDVAAVEAGLPTLEGTFRVEAGLPEANPLVEWAHRPFDHPCFILFSSGTTGAPKCIVHGAGGTLIEHVKEHRLHCDVQPGDAVLYTTTTGWMMWNWLVSALATGARVVLYDGSTSHPERDSLLRAVANEKVTHFGTSPVYLQYLEDAGVEPGALDLSSLRAVMSTGSVLHPWQYDGFAEHFGDLPLQSISGGTDIVGCFVLGNPNTPVIRGESQCVSFGYDVRVKTDAGYERQGTGELVCCAPFPSRPIGLWNDPLEERFHAAYFAENEGVWTHGDFLELTATGARILGRSDAVMNIRGVRVGPAEIYTALHDLPEYADLMAVTQPDPKSPGGERLVLLAVMADGVELDRKLVLRTKKTLKTRASMYHVPAVIAAVSDLPTTHSGKRSERAARDLLAGRKVRNRHALRNPEVLEELAGHPALAG